MVGAGMFGCGYSARAMSQAPAPWHARAKRQSLETPRITPRLPCIRPELCGIGAPVEQ